MAAVAAHAAAVAAHEYPWAVLSGTAGASGAVAASTALVAPPQERASEAAAAWEAALRIVWKMGGDCISPPRECTSSVLDTALLERPAAAGRAVAARGGDGRSRVGGSAARDHPRAGTFGRGRRGEVGVTSSLSVDALARAVVLCSAAARTVAAAPALPRLRSRRVAAVASATELVRGIMSLRERKAGEDVETASRSAPPARAPVTLGVPVPLTHTRRGPPSLPLAPAPAPGALAPGALAPGPCASRHASAATAAAAGIGTRRGCRQLAGALLAAF